MPAYVELSNTAPPKIGSFRSDEVNLRKILPPDIYHDVFDEIKDGIRIEDLIKVKSGKVQLNNAAFGTSYESVRSLSVKLRAFSEENPDVFYDQAYLPLMTYTYSVAEKFFGTDKVVMVPNCTFGMKAVADYLIYSKKHTSIGCLLPIYGATEKLLQYYEINDSIKSLCDIAPGENINFEEDPVVILNSLRSAYEESKFTVLFCDETASQSGRILPLKKIASFCQQHCITLVVDGTQSSSLLLPEQRDVMDQVDYFVMSTHKWLGNVKTCGVIRCKDEIPTPPAISFGWKPNQKSQSTLASREGYMWLGMLDSYISYICLSKALKMFSKYGARQIKVAASNLHNGLSNILAVTPLLPSMPYRVINSFRLRSSQFEPINDVTKIQNKMQTYGINMSIKKFGQSCSNVEEVPSLTEKLHKMTKGYIHNVDNFHIDANGVYQDELSSIGQENLYDRNGEAVKKLHINNGHDTVGIEKNDIICKRATRPLYCRISCWSFNKESDFLSLQMVLQNNVELSRVNNESLLQQFLFLQELYENLFSVLSTDALFTRAEKLRHPLVFYLGHTAVFYINKLIASGYLRPSDRIDPKFESVFAVGVDEMSWDDLLEDNYDWSRMNQTEREMYVDQVQNYRSLVKKVVTNLIIDHHIQQPISQDSLEWIILMGIEHEKIHLETSAVIISQVPIRFIKKRHKFNFPTYWKEHPAILSVAPESVPQNELVSVRGGTAKMGKDYVEENVFGWDNEFGGELCTLEPFEVSKMLVSNAEYLQFVEAGGYTEAGKKWWSEEGWKYVTDLKVSGPRFWVGREKYRSLVEEITMPWHLPVEVNNLEAEAFCNWKGEMIGRPLRLISHEESYLMRQNATSETSNSNLNQYASPTPVNLNGGILDGQLIYDISGNVWRHSVSVLTVMNGFKAHPVYTDFTLPTIDGRHNHILGGSWISLGNCANLGARYGFRRHFYQYAGIRYVCSKNDYKKSVPNMFTEFELTRCITEHYSEFKDDTLVEKKPLGNWPKRLSEEAIPYIKKQQGDLSQPIKVLIVHGGAGRATLELLRGCSNLAIDHTETTANTLQVLERLIDDSNLQWYQQVEGTLSKPLQYHLNAEENAEMLLKDKNNTISYYQADYNNLRPQLDGYDIILGDFRYLVSDQMLTHITSRLKDGGRLIMGTVNDFGDKSKAIKSLSEMYDPEDMVIGEFPNIRQETRNKHQYAISFFSVWQKKNGTCDTKQEIQDTTKPEELTTAQYYEDDNILNSYFKFHFGPGHLGLSNFPSRVASLCIDACKELGVKMESALDAGCGPGGSSVHLSKAFNKVEAYDYSQSFVNMLLKVKSDENLTNLTAYQGDAHKQQDTASCKKFDLILGCNLIDRLHTPKDWVLQSKSMLTKDGLLIISSPYTWSDQHTDPSQFLGGFMEDGEEVSTVRGLQKLLEPELCLLKEVKVPFVIPDADGTFQYTYSNCTIFSTPR